MGFFAYIRQDSARNRGNTKGKVLTLLFRTAAYCSQGRFRRLIGFPYLVFYRFFVEWILGCELPWSTRVGPGLRIFHGHALVVNKHTVIGANCTLRQSTTIGNAQDGSPSPVIGDNVEIGANVCIIGAVDIGNGAVIGAGAVVVKSIPSGAVAAGNPARLLRIVEPASASLPHNGQGTDGGKQNREDYGQTS